MLCRAVLLVLLSLSVVGPSSGASAATGRRGQPVLHRVQRELRGIVKQGLGARVKLWNRFRRFRRAGQAPSERKDLAARPQPAPADTRANGKAAPPSLTRVIDEQRQALERQNGDYLRGVDAMLAATLPSFKPSAQFYSRRDGVPPRVVADWVSRVLWHQTIQQLDRVVREVAGEDLNRAMVDNLGAFLTASMERAIRRDRGGEDTVRVEVNRDDVMRGFAATTTHPSVRAAVERVVAKFQSMSAEEWRGFLRETDRGAFYYLGD